MLSDTFNCLIALPSFGRRFKNKGQISNGHAFVQKQTAKGLVTENVVKKVKRHIPAPRQLDMPLLPPTETDDDNPA